MKLLLRNVRVADPASPYQGKEVDLFLQGDQIAEVGPGLTVKPRKVMDMEGAWLSPGWIDITAQVGDPGFEHREDLHTAMAAAAAGGFTGIGCLPNTRPVCDSKAGIHYLRQAARNTLVELFPVGAISQGCQGKDITEMFDMHQAGARAFSDGSRSVQDGGLMLRALQYATAFGGVVLNQSHNASVALDGQMHEGITSTRLGLRGIPGLSETLMIQRDLSLLAYTGGRLHVSNVSTAEGVAMIRQAKADGLGVTCSVAAHNLLFVDEDLAEFSTNLKVLPPLRSIADREALIEGVRDRTIDIISGNHVPLEEELKKLEFPFAAFGATGLQTAYALARTATEGKVHPDILVECFATAPRRLFGLPDIRIEAGQPACLTLFDPERSWTPEASVLRSKSDNEPALGKVLQGRPLAVINRGLIEILN